MPDLDVANSTASVSGSDLSKPDYIRLVRFLVQPFLEQPESLSVDCESFARGSRILVRVAFEGEDKGRVFGRGGRNIQAIRTVLQAAAIAAGQVVHLDIYNSGGNGGEMESDEPRSGRSPDRRSSSHPSPKLRSRS